MNAKATVTKALSDAQVIDAAWKLIRNTNVIESLPPRHTLVDIWKASKALQDLGLRFLDAYGDRLKRLDCAAYNELTNWKNTQL